MRKAKKVPKKRGRRPGVKVGPYKKRSKPSTKTLDYYSDLFKDTNDMKIGDTLRIRLPKDYVATDGPDIPKYSPAPVLTLCGQLEDSILLLENRISNAIAKINSLM